MTSAEKIDKIIVNLFSKILWIEDADVLEDIEKSLKQKDLFTKERILTDLYDKSNVQKESLSDMELEIIMEKHNISEWYNDYFENKEK